MRALTIEANAPLPRESEDIKYDLKYVDDYGELARELSISASASYSTGTAGGSARANFFRSSTMSRTHAYVLVYMTIETRSESLSTYQLNDTALQAARRSPSDFFYKGHGDAFVSAIIYGGELFALMEFSASSAAESESLRVSVKAEIGNFGGGVDLQQKVRSLTTGRNVHIRYAQSGGNTGQPVNPPPARGGVAPVTDPGGGVITLNPEQLIYRLREFPPEVRNFPQQAKPLFAELKDYSLVSNWPDGSSPPTPSLESRRLNGVVRVMLALQNELATINDVLNLDAYQAAAFLSAANAKKPYLEYATEKMEQIVAGVAANPSDTSKIFMESFAQYRSERVLGLPSDTWRGNAGLMCDVTEPDTSRVKECLLGPASTWKFENWPTIKSFSARRGWYGEKDVRHSIVQSYASPDWAGTFNIPGHQLTQDYANRLCGKKTPNDGVFAFFEPVPSTGFSGNCCGYVAVNLTCVVLEKPAAALVAILPVYIRGSAAPQTQQAKLDSSDGSAVFVIKPACSPAFGRYQIALWASGSVVNTVTGYWRVEKETTLEARHPLPASGSAVASADVKLEDTFCEVAPDSKEAQKVLKMQSPK
jgi:hypothetical protein